MKDKDIFNALKGFEELVTDILLWIVFIPKTLFKIIADPDGASDYVKKKMDGDGKFEDYISPILLFLVTSLLLFVIYNTLESGTQRVAGAEKIVTELQGSQGVLAGLGFLSLPLLFALAIELFGGEEGITQKAIKRAFYIQCYYFSPLTLSLFAFILLTELLPDDELIGPLSLLLLVPVSIWFLIVEIKTIAQELKSKTLKALKAIGVFTLLIAFILGGIILLLLLFASETDEFFAGEPEMITEALPKNDPYSISVRGFENSAGDYRLTLIEQPSCLENNSPNDRPLAYGECIVGSVTGEASSEWTFQGSKEDNIIILVKPDPELDIGVGLYDETGKIQFKDNSFQGGPEAIIQTLPSDAEFYIEVESYENSAGNYHLTLIKLQQPCSESSSVKGRFLQYNNCVRDQVAESASSSWAFEGSENDDITVLVEPGSEFDAKVDVLDKSRRSIQGEAQAFNFIIVIIGLFYLLVIGWAVTKGFWSMFRKPKEATTQKEEPTE